MAAASDLAALKNLGPVSQRWLHDVGIHTRADLADLGPVLAYKIVKHRHPGATVHLLYALAGALQDVHWLALPDEVKAHLREEASAPLHVGPAS